jgi:hypothetical protein
MSPSMDRTTLRERIKQLGMRNLDCVPTDPAAAISNTIRIPACN